MGSTLLFLVLERLRMGLNHPRASPVLPKLPRFTRSALGLGPVLRF